MTGGVSSRNQNKPGLVLSIKISVCPDLTSMKYSGRLCYHFRAVQQAELDSGDARLPTSRNNPVAVFYTVRHFVQFCMLWLDSGENFGPAVNILSGVVWLSRSWCEGTNKETQTPTRFPFPLSPSRNKSVNLLPLSGYVPASCSCLTLLVTGQFFDRNLSCCVERFTSPSSSKSCPSSLLKV